jgi:hypothetical protein
MTEAHWANAQMTIKRIQFKGSLAGFLDVPTQPQSRITSHH